MGIGATQTFKVQTVKGGETTDVTADVKWTSSDVTIATVDGMGVATGVSKGDVMIVATVGTLTASATLTVSDAALTAIALSPSKPSIAPDTSQQFTATGSYSDGTARDISDEMELTWSSSDTNIVSIDAQGLASALAAGSVTITATLGGVSGTTTLSVSTATLQTLAIDPAASSLAKGTTSALKLTGVFSDSTTQDLTDEASWSSDDDTIVSVSDDADTKGVVSAVMMGATSVHASFQGKTANATLVVTDAKLQSIAITPVDPALSKGSEITLTATGVFSDDSNQDLSSTVVWTSSDTTIAVVSNAAGTKGKVTTLEAGSVTITAARNDISAVVNITVTDAQLVSLAITAKKNSLAEGTDLQLTATGTYSDASTQDLTSQVNWLSSDSDIISVDNSDANKGKAHAVTTGSATITASLGPVSATISLSGTPAVLKRLVVTATPAPEVPLGIVRAFTAMGDFTDGSSHDLTSDVIWTSSNADVASISNASGSQGKATGLMLGTTDITATRNGITSQAVTLAVTEATLERIEITPPATSVPKGSPAVFSATGVFSDGHTDDVTDLVTWSSSNGNVAGISNADGSRGHAMAIDVGTSSIRAALDGKMSPAATLNVTAATLKSLAVTPATPSIAKGTTEQLIATGTYSDDTTQDLTALVMWAAEDGGVASVSNAGGSRGVARGLTTGGTDITATLGNIVSPAIHLDVTDASLDSISIDPPAASIARGTTQAFTATGHFSDLTTQQITGSVTWTSSNPMVVTIDGNGLATGVTSGTSAIRATLDGIQSSEVTLRVTMEVLTSLVVEPGTKSTPLGRTTQFKATGVFSDASTQDLTSLVTWSVDGAAASISNADCCHGLASTTQLGSSKVSASYAGITSNQAVLTVTNAVLQSIAVTPDVMSIANGLTQNFQARGTYSDGTSQFITQQVTWTSSDPTVAAISSATGTAGLANALSVGVATLRAVDPETGSFGTATLTVTPAVVDHILITPDNAQIAVGTTLQFTAVGVFTDASHHELTSAATWASSDNGKAQVSNASHGLATGLAAGRVQIRASYAGVTGYTTLTVSSATLTSIVVEPMAPSVAKGLTASLTATGYFSDQSFQDLTTQVSWSTDNGSVATVSNAAGSEGVVSTHALGMAEISASMLGQTGSTTVTVTDKKVVLIWLTSDALSKPKGTTAHFTATGTYSDGSIDDITEAVDWSSSDTAILDDCNPVVLPDHCFQAKATGIVNVTARIMGVAGYVTASNSFTVTAAALVSIAVDPPSPSVAKGLSRQMSAIGTYTDNSTQPITDQVTWSSSNDAMAQFDSDPAGQITAKMVGGPVTLTATIQNISGTATLTVTDAVLKSIGVTPAAISVAKGLHQQYTAVGVYSDNSTVDHTADVLWDTSDHAVATVSSAPGTAGLATAIGVGMTDVTAHLSGITGSTGLTVTDAVLQQIQITSAHASIAKGTPEQYSAIGVYSDGSNQDLTTQVSWSTSNPSVATIGLHDGLLHSLQTGPVIILADLGMIGDTRNLTITAAELQSIQVGRSTDASVPKGTTSQFTATGVYTDNTNQDITGSVTWSSSAPTSVSISNLDGQRGFATALSVGSATITATSGMMTGSSSLTVTAAVQTALNITPLTPSIASGTTKQFTATATYSDATTTVVTSSATWSSSNGAVAVVSNSTGSRGLAASVGTGSTTITASFGGFSANTTLTVTPATLVTISVTPGFPLSPLGFTKRFTATGTYTDGTTQDLTSSVTWTSNNVNVAIVSNEVSSKGLATTVHTGSAVIRATLGNKAGQTTFTVSNAALQSIDVTPLDATLNACDCETLVATGHFSDGTTAVITNDVTFTSDDQTIVSIADSDPGPGLLMRACSAINAGTTTITATDSDTGISGLTTATNSAACGSE